MQDVDVDVDVDGSKAGERDCGQQEALAKGEPRVNTDDKTVTEGADFWKQCLPEINGYNCFPTILLTDLVSSENSC